MHFWRAVTALGDSGVMIPVAALVGLWLCNAQCYRLAGLWAATVAAVGLTVASSKLLFMGWCLGMRSIDFTGISGHSAMAALVLPVLAGLVQQSMAGRVLSRTWPIGEALAILVGVSRLAVHVHSVSEVVAGLLLGFGAARLFQRAASRVEGKPVSPTLAAGSMLLLPALFWFQPAPTQHLLEHVAVMISDHRAAFTRQAETCDLQNWQVLQGPGHGTPRQADSSGRGASRASAK
jgi:membrane-associated phospholipid phosphatase